MKVTKASVDVAACICNLAWNLICRRITVVMSLVKPNKELRSVTLKRALKTYIIPVIVNRYNVISIRTLLEEKEGDLVIWGKRRLMENLLSKETHVAGFFSCITGIEERSKKGEDVEKKVIPGICFWVFFDWPEHGLGTFEVKLMKLFLESGMSIKRCSLVNPRGQSNSTPESRAAASLFITLKDHNCEEAKQMTYMSNVDAVNKVTKKEGYELKYVAICEGDDYSYKPLQLYLTTVINPEVAMELLAGLKKVDLDLKIIDKSIKTSVSSMPHVPKSKIMVAMDVVKRYMMDNRFGLFDGSIYKKAPEAVYTYVFCSSVKVFIMNLLGNSEIAEEIVAFVPTMINLLSEPSCKLIEPIIIDYNFVECLPVGTCFNIMQKMFEHNPNTLNGSPRAYVRYCYDEKVEPNPELFIEGIENSFPVRRIRMNFYKKYYQILLHQKFPMKETKLLLVGPPDSGKTSWFAPFQGVIPSDYIAGVVRDGNFSGHLIKENTQVVFMDEWTSDSLCCEDAKRILQGGLIMLPQKHKDAVKFKFNSGFFITTNIYPDFGPGDDAEAIKKRLAIFETKPLKRKNPTVTEWLRKNCLEVFHYVANQLKDIDLFDSRPINTEEANQGAIYNDFDSNPLDLLGGITSMPCYSQSSNMSNYNRHGEEEMEIVPRKAVEHALLEADREESIFVDFLSFESELYDISTKKVDLEYMEKVYRIATVQNQADFAKIHITDSATDIFDMRRRNNWTGPDSVYDAWLLVHGYKRSWFPYSRFFRKYPDAKEKMEEKRKLFQNFNDDAIEDSEEENQNKRKANESATNPPKKFLSESEVAKFLQ